MKSAPVPVSIVNQLVQTDQHWERSIRFVVVWDSKAHSRSERLT